MFPPPVYIPVEDRRRNVCRAQCLIYSLTPDGASNSLLNAGRQSNNFCDVALLHPVRAACARSLIWVCHPQHACGIGFSMATRREAPLPCSASQDGAVSTISECSSSAEGVSARHPTLGSRENGLSQRNIRTESMIYRNVMRSSRDRSAHTGACKRSHGARQSGGQKS